MYVSIFFFFFLPSSLRTSTLPVISLPSLAPMTSMGYHYHQWAWSPFHSAWAQKHRAPMLRLFFDKKAFVTHVALIFLWWAVFPKVTFIVLFQKWNRIPPSLPVPHRLLLHCTLLAYLTPDPTPWMDAFFIPLGSGIPQQAIPQLQQALTCCL